MRVGGLFTIIRMIKKYELYPQVAFKGWQKIYNIRLERAGFGREMTDRLNKKMASIEVEAVPNPQVLEALIKLANLMKGRLGWSRAENNRETNSPTDAFY